MDILKDYNIVNEHPKKINTLMNKLLEQEKSTRVECFELYEEITNRMQSCIFEMEELSSYNINNNSGSEDASGGAELREAFARLEERLENLKQAKSILENVSAMLNNIQKKSAETKNFSQKCNNVFVVTVNKLIDLDRRG